MIIASVEALNEQARRNTFTLDDIPWERGVDPEQLFGPESMSHLFYCPSYPLLSPEEKRTYNQVHAAGICEQFVFLEELLLVQGLSRLLDRAGDRIEAGLAEAIRIFVAEERKHGQMFDRLLKLADPGAYGQERFVVYRLSRSETTFLDFCLSRPETFLWWVWIAVLFEEKTLDFYRKYRAAPDQDAIAPLFTLVHRFHAMDEVRHFQLDHHFVDTFWQPAPRWKRWINHRIFWRMMHSFTHPRRTVRHAVARLVERHPRLSPMRDRLMAEALSVYRNREWQEAFYSRDALPHTFALFDRFPELADLSGVFPLYEPPRERTERPPPPAC